MQTAIEAAQNFLLRREHSVVELRRKLSIKQYDPDEIEDALTRMLKAGYLSDQRFAEHYTRHRASAGFGVLRIENELLARGVSEADIALGISLYEGSWCANAQIVREKKFGLNWPSNFKEIAKQKNFLQYRGFSSDEIKQVVDNEECRNS